MTSLHELYGFCGRAIFSCPRSCSEHDLGCYAVCLYPLVYDEHYCTDNATAEVQKLQEEFL